MINPQCLEEISMVQKMFEPLTFDCTDVSLANRAPGKLSDGPDLHCFFMYVISESEYRGGSNNNDRSTTVTSL